MSEMMVLSREGDTRLMWNPHNTTEVEAARNMFDELKGQRYIAYRVEESGDKGEVIREFDPEASKIIMAPPMVGG